MSSVIYIVIGLLVLFLTFLLLTWALTGFYFWVSKENVDWIRDLKISSSLAGSGVVASLLLMVVASTAPIYIFGLASALLSGLLYGVLLKNFWKFSYFDASIISFTLAIILNLCWLRLLGII